MPFGENGGSKRKEAPNEGRFRETLGCLARAKEVTLVHLEPIQELIESWESDVIP